MNIFEGKIVVKKGRKVFFGLCHTYPDFPEEYAHLITSKPKYQDDILNQIDQEVQEQYPHHYNRISVELDTILIAKASKVIYILHGEILVTEVHFERHHFERLCIPHDVFIAQYYDQPYAQLYPPKD